MNHPNPFRRTAMLAALTTLLASPLASAQPAGTDYPTKPITIVAAYPPGGSTDLTTRFVAQEMSEHLGVPVVVENVSGAGGAIGAYKVARAAPDGYTLMVGASNELAINKLITKNSKYDLKDFTGIGLIATQPLVLVASAQAGPKTAAEFMQKAAQNPGKLNYGSSGVGTALHLAGEMIQQQGSVSLTHVPYRGVAPLAADLMGNNLEYGVFVLSSGLPHIQSGKVVALGTTAAKRSSLTPDVPALAELPQLKNMDIEVWFALVGPAKLPEAVKAKLKTALNATLQSPEFRKKMTSTGSTVADAAVPIDAFMQGEVEKLRKVVEFAKIEQ